MQQKRPWGRMMPGCCLHLPQWHITHCRHTLCTMPPPPHHHCHVRCWVCLGADCYMYTPLFPMTFPPQIHTAAGSRLPINSPFAYSTSSHTHMHPSSARQRWVLHSYSKHNLQYAYTHVYTHICTYMYMYTHRYTDMSTQKTDGCLHMQQYHDSYTCLRMYTHSTTPIARLHNGYGQWCAYTCSYTTTHIGHS